MKELAEHLLSESPSIVDLICPDYLVRYCFNGAGGLPVFEDCYISSQIPYFLIVFSDFDDLFVRRERKFLVL